MPPSEAGAGTARPWEPANAAIGRAAADPERLWPMIRSWAAEAGLSAVGVAELDLQEASARLQGWLALGRHGAMDYMARHAALRAQPTALLPGAIRAISVRLDYWPIAADPLQNLGDPQRAYVSRYALGRDYHKVLRTRLQTLASRICTAVEGARCRVCVDSAPVFETELAHQAGLGWRGKHTLTLARSGSWHFLGEILTNLPLPPSAPGNDHCGHCTRCIDACPTGAIVAPYELDARRCISYLTIEHPGSIPETLRTAVGNRIYGCDDCQLVCPWNRFARATGETDFAPRNGLDRHRLIELFAWSAEEFNDRLAGSAIRRIGWERWLRNIAVALGNAWRQSADESVSAALRTRADHRSALVREHVAWALGQRDPA
jgi:epoxyqueuosine reductase